MDNRLENLYSKLSLTEREKEEIEFDMKMMEEAVWKSGNCLVFRLLTKHPYNNIALKNTMRRAWRPVNMLKFRNLS